MINSSDAKRLNTAARVAALTLANAMIFQAELSEVDHRVRPLRVVMDEADPVEALAMHWQFICEEINYVPIFRLAREVLINTPARAEVNDALRQLSREVLMIVSERAALRHDLMGRIYHRLLLEAKFLGTFYTSVPAATLLLKLSLDPKRWDIDWSDLDALRQLRVADLACGTGTLLMAAQQAITDNHINAIIDNAGSVGASDLRELHRAIMEEMIYGYDVLSSAIHLTASTLALLAPEIAFRTMHLYVLPMGRLPHGGVALGSIDFLRSDKIETQIDLMGAVTAWSEPHLPNQWQSQPAARS